MTDAVASPFVVWANFYVIVGSSAAALTGLMFVVIALIADQHRNDSSPENISAFGTPTLVHFCAVLIAAAILSAPWRTMWSPAVTLCLASAAGVGYEIVVTRRASRSTGYQPVLEDWIWHTILPMLSYLAIFVASMLLLPAAENALFAIAASSVLLLVIGIHNAWDTVTYIALTRRQHSP
jgi:hypothetical protein